MKDNDVLWDRASKYLNQLDECDNGGDRGLLMIRFIGDENKAKDKEISKLRSTIKDLTKDFNALGVKHGEEIAEYSAGWEKMREELQAWVDSDMIRNSVRISLKELISLKQPSASKAGVGSIEARGRWKAFSECQDKAKEIENPELFEWCRAKGAEAFHKSPDAPRIKPQPNSEEVK